MDYVYLIWSFQHNAWWKEDGQGYSEDINEAGEYSFNQALEIVLGANWMYRNGEKNSNPPDEAMIPIKKKFVMKEQ